MILAACTGHRVTNAWCSAECVSFVPYSDHSRSVNCADFGVIKDDGVYTSLVRQRCLNGTTASYLAQSIYRTADVRGRRHLCSSTRQNLIHCFVHSTVVRSQSPTRAGRETICQYRPPSIDSSKHSCTEWWSSRDNRVDLALWTAILVSTFWAYLSLCVNCHCMQRLYSFLHCVTLVSFCTKSQLRVFSSVNILQGNTWQPSCYTMWKLCADFLSTVFLPRGIFAGRS